MTLVLFETPAGFALFKLLKEKALKNIDTLWQEFETLEKANDMVALKAFNKFDNTTDALAAAASMVDSKLPKQLKKFLKKHCVDDKLAVIDAKLGKVISEKLGLSVISGSEALELSRGIRSQLTGLVAGLEGTNMTAMSLGLSHSLSRYKLKFSPDKVDTMVVQAINLLDDLDKELNTYAMRVREWYGWHFPEMSKIMDSNIAYSKCVLKMRSRDKAADTDFSDILEEEVESQLKDAAVVSMGTEISEDDLSHVLSLCEQVLELSEYRAQLYEYLKNRMQAIAPNLTVLVGELVGARLIAHAGTLMNLAKAPASTVQILGAEKALFRALKTKHATPKYGLIFHASLIGQASSKNKGKVSRVLAAKCALAIRVDALGEGTDASMGLEARAKVEARLRQMEGRELEGGAVQKEASGPAKYDKSKPNGSAVAAPAAAYNADADVALDTKKSKKMKREDADDEDEQPKKKKKKTAAAEETDADEKPKKKAKKAAEADEEDQQPTADKEKKKKKKKSAE